MANTWLRLWHDMPNDPKWRTIARVSKQPIALVQSVYLHLMVDASRNVTRGHISVTAEDLASALDVTESEIQSITDAMQGRVLDGMTLSGWDARQPKREDEGNQETGSMSAAERKRRQREREKERAAEERKDASHEMSRDVTTDKDKDKDKETTPPREESDRDMDVTKRDVSASLPSADPVAGPKPEGTPEGAIAGSLRKLSVSITSMNPTLRAWVSDGYSLPQILEAVEIARMSKPLPETIPAAYIDAVLRNARRQPESRQSAPPPPVIHDTSCCHEESGVRCGARSVKGKNGRWYCNEHKQALVAT